MRLVSSRGKAAPASLAKALRSGIAPDGGLYLPNSLVPAAFDGLAADRSLANFAKSLLHPFFVGDVLEQQLPAICAEAFDFDAPLIPLEGANSTLTTLELFHGPTGAFKDFGARFLMGCFDRLAKPQAPLTVLAATSGDTGAAVGCAAEGRSSVRAVILYPKGRVSPFQERQLTCWGENVLAIEVDGDFDDCQRLVKAAFGDQSLARDHRLTSANSINFGRLLPQFAYAAHAAMRLFRDTGEKPGFVVPTGNLGHGYAVLLARSLGLPVGPVVLATNANRTLKDWKSTGQYRPGPSVRTLANAMDVGNPSNFERLAALPAAAREVQVELVTDDEIGARIRADYDTSGTVWCPHSATAAEAWSRLPEAERLGRPWIVAATAHPYKFAETVEPLIGRPIEPSPALAAIHGRALRKVRISASLWSLAGALRERAAAA